MARADVVDGNFCCHGWGWQLVYCQHKDVEGVRVKELKDRDGWVYEGVCIGGKGCFVIHTLRFSVAQLR